MSNEELQQQIESELKLVEDIAKWAGDSCQMHQISVEEFDYASEFDMRMAQASQELTGAVGAIRIALNLAAPAVANAAPADERAAFDTWHMMHFGYARHKTVGDKLVKSRWETWQSALAAKAPQAAMTDAAIMKIANEWAMASHGYENDPFGYCIDFARAIEAAAAPNAGLVEALQGALAVMNNECDPDEYAGPFAKVRAALAAAGVKVAS